MKIWPTRADAVSWVTVKLGESGIPPSATRAFLGEFPIIAREMATPDDAGSNDGHGHLNTRFKFVIKDDDLKLLDNLTAGLLAGAGVGWGLTPTEQNSAQIVAAITGI